MGGRQVTSGGIQGAAAAHEFAGLRVTVAGLGVSGVSAARALAGLGAGVTVVDGGD
jgi:UDP-N-acetylmuramoylalanine--D-glutamate ligase